MTESRSRTVPFLITVLFLACIFSLAIIKTSDYDAWIHLTFGRLIWNLKAIPASEPFIPAMAGKPFSYSSWLFGLIYYGAYHFSAGYGVVLLKAASVLAIFGILLRDALIPFRNRSLAVTVLIVIAVCMRARFVERPDTFLLIFLPCSIMALNVYLREGDRRYLYLLPLVHLLWANCHSSINLMFVPFTAVFVGGAVATLIARKGMVTATTLDGRQARFIGTILVASLLCALISPYGINQFTFAAQFLKLDVFKQEILELQQTTWMPGYRWFFILLGFTAASFPAAGKRLSLVDLVCLLPFVYLGFLSRRFVFVFAVVAAPILIRNFSFALQRLPQPSQQLRGVGSIAVAIWIAGWTAISFAGVGPWRIPWATPGFGFNLMLQPEGALRYMDSRNINGRIFNYFPWGQYIEWRDTPRRIPFVDGRGYLTPELMEQFFSETDLDRLSEQYGIDAFLVSYPKQQAGTEGVIDRDLGLSVPGWVLVYWDDNALLYLKRGGNYDYIVRRDQYHFAKPANSLKAVESVATIPEQGKLLVEELQRAQRDTGSGRAGIMLGYAYKTMGQNREAIETLLGVKDTRFQGTVSQYLGECYEQTGNIDQALTWYRAALREGESSALQCRIGELSLKNNDREGALKHLKRAVELNPTSYETCTKLAEAYQKMGRENDAAEIIKKVQGTYEAEKLFDDGVKAYQEGKVQEAAASFKRAISANPTNPLPYVNFGFTQIDLGAVNDAFASFQHALRLQPDCALAHYGIAMVYKMRGDTTSAHDHWRQYLRIEPTGHFARMVKKELEGE
jgi:tetratricopeptide (TPR) repeat protein